MFGHEKSSNAAQKRGASAKDTGVTILTSGCHFTGKLYCRGATRIGGTIEGQVIAEGLLIIEDEAVVQGDVDAEDIVVHGRLEGKIVGRNRIEFCSSSDVDADVVTPSLVIHDGALFNGKTTMTRKVATTQSSDHKSTGQGGKLASMNEKVDDKSKSGEFRNVARISDVKMNDLEPEPAI
jgi:cytoskeletal protein CcmA (bactofilin family)